MKCIKCRKYEVGSIPVLCSLCKSKNGLPLQSNNYIPPPRRPRGFMVSPNQKPKVFELDRATNIIERDFRKNYKYLKKL